MKVLALGFADTEDEIMFEMERFAIGKDIREIQDILLSGASDIFMEFFPDSSASINIRLWKDREPPFRHTSIFVRVATKEANVIEVIEVKKVDFGI